MSVRRRVAVLSLSLCFPLLFGLLLFDAVSAARMANGAPAAPIVDTLIDESDGDCEDGDCSLRDAIAVATPGDTIQFNVVGTVVLSPALNVTGLVITKNLTIDGGGLITVSGNNEVRVFNVKAGSATFDNLTIADGYVHLKSSDCAGDPDSRCGGGIMMQNNSVAVTVTNSTLSGNSAGLGAGFGGGAIFNGWGKLKVVNSILSGNSATYAGGCILNYGTLTVTNSTLSDNTVGDDGGGIFTDWGSVTINNSTLSGSSAGWDGGGIYISGGTVTVNNSTISGNSAGTKRGGGIHNRGNMTLNNSSLSGNSAGTGGGIFNYERIMVNNSTIFDNSATDSGGGISSVGSSDIFATISNTIVSGNVFSPSMAADDLSLAYDTTNSFTSGGYNLVGAIDSDITSITETGDITNTLPILGPLADNGGDTFTHMPLPGSLATDNGQCSGGPAADQRGVARPQDDSCDIGAFERNCSIAVVNNQSSGTGSLRHAIATVCDGGLITFDNALAGSSIDISPDGELRIDKSVTISGTVPIIIGGSNAVRVFNVTAGNVSFDSLTIANGKANNCGMAPTTCGGGINLKNGGVTVTVTDSTLSGNSADFGGGINNHGIVTINNSTLSSNSAADRGGGINNFSSSTATVNNSTLTNNRAGTSGGGIASYGDSSTSTTIAFTIVSGNTISGTTTADDLALSYGSTGSFSSGGYNLIGAIGPDITFAGSGDQTGINDPVLGPLADYGGDTKTHALLPGSPAIDAGGSCGVTTDQRGIERPQGSACDTGAFESRGFSLTQSGGSPQTTAVNTPFANPLSLTASSAFNEPVAGGKVTFSAPASGASLTFTETVATIGSDGAASLPVTANGSVGSYQVEANAIGSSGPELIYNLTNTLHDVFLPVLIK